MSGGDGELSEMKPPEGFYLPPEWILRYHMTAPKLKAAKEIVQPAVMEPVIEPSPRVTPQVDGYVTVFGKRVMLPSRLLPRMNAGN